MTKFKATFFISTGRCGTQWLFRTLKEVYGKDHMIRHEVSVDHYNSAHHFEEFHTTKKSKPSS